MPEGPGLYNFPAMRRGDTFRARDLATLTQDGVALALTSARLQVRPQHGGEALLEWDTDADTPTASITGAGSNIVRLSAKTAAEMQMIAPGTHEYDLEVVFASDGAKLTILAGRFPVTPDITRTTT